MKKRLEWIDALRGIAMVLVVYGHSAPYASSFFLWTSPVKMPLFFMISGYLFHAPEKSLDFFKKLARTIIFPWLVLGTLPALSLILAKGIGDFLSYEHQIITGEAIWFMPCFIWAEIIQYYLVKYNDSNKYYLVLSILFSVIGLIFTRHNILDFMMINRALSVQLFFMLGHYFRIYDSFLFNRDWELPCALTILYVTLTIIVSNLYPGRAIDIHQGIYNNYVISFSTIIFGCYILFYVFKRIEQFPKWLLFVGMNTLIIYIWHDWILMAFYKIVGATVQIEPSILLSITGTLISIAFVSACAILINRYFPYIVGRKKAVK